MGFLENLKDKVDDALEKTDIDEKFKDQIPSTKGVL